MSARQFSSELPPIPEDPYIFLGGTCGGNDWRADFKAAMRYAIQDGQNKVLYDPRVQDWSPEIAAKEIDIRARATGIVNYLGNPNDEASTASMYSGAEAMLDALTRPLDTAIVLEISPWSNLHEDKQRRNLAKLIEHHSPDTTPISRS